MMINDAKPITNTAVYQINYFISYSEAFQKGNKHVYVEASDGLEASRGELEALCRKKIHENLKIDRWEKLSIVKLV